MTRYLLFIKKLFDIKKEKTNRKMKIGIKKYFEFPTWYVILILLCFYPYVFNCFLNLGSETVLLLVAMPFTGVLLFAGKNRNKGDIPPFLLKCVIVQVFIWVCYAVIHSDSSYITRIFFILFSLMLLAFLKKRGSLYHFTDTYNHFIALQAVLGVPIFFLFALNLIQPLSSFHNIDGRECYFFGVTFSNAITSGIIRIAGFFDEPGAFAYWGIYAQVINKLTVDNKKLEIALVISLLFTLSAAYFVQLLLYVVFFYGTKAKTMIPVVLVLGIVTIFTFRFLGQNEQLMYLTVERFQGGTIRSERNELTEEAKKVFAESPMFGIGAKNLQDRGYFDDNPYEIPAKDGVVGFIITYLPLFAVFFKYGLKNKNIFFALIILAAGYLQRPFHVNLLHSFMLYLLVMLIYYKSKGYEERC